MTNSTAAETAFAIQKQAALDLLAILGDKVEAHTKSGDMTDWSHVGDMGRIVEKLAELI